MKSTFIQPQFKFYSFISEKCIRQEKKLKKKPYYKNKTIFNHKIECRILPHFINARVKNQNVIVAKNFVYLIDSISYITQSCHIFKFIT